MTNWAANTASVFLNYSLTVPLTVENLEAVVIKGRVRPSWGLSSEALHGLSGIRLERAPTGEGPYASCTAAPLEPAQQTSFDDIGTLDTGTSWYPPDVWPRGNARKLRENLCESTQPLH